MERIGRVNKSDIYIQAKVKTSGYWPLFIFFELKHYNVIFTYLILYVILHL
jgi:hypothetical protein